MDNAARNEILTAFGNIQRQTEKVGKQITNLHVAVLESSSFSPAWERLWSARANIWVDYRDAWERIKEYIHGDVGDIQLKHKAIRIISEKPEDFGALQTSWFRGDARARALAKEPYDILKRGYAQAGEYAAEHVLQLMMDSMHFPSMTDRLADALGKVQAVEALPLRDDGEASHLPYA